MATTDATPFPVKSEAYRVYFVIKSSATGNPIAGGLTALACTISKDGSAFAAPSASPVEIGTTGWGYVELSAAEMAYSAVVVSVTASNANAVAWSTVVYLQRETATTPGSFPTDIYTIGLWGLQTMAGLQTGPVNPGATGTITIMARDGVTPKWTRSLTPSSNITTISAVTRV